MLIQQYHSNISSPEGLSIKSLGLVATSVQEVISDYENTSANLDTLLMELEVQSNNIITYSLLNTLLAAIIAIEGKYKPDDS